MGRPGRVFVRQFKQAAVKLVKVGGQEFVVVDDGITMYNNPAFQVFLMATVALYKDGVACGIDRHRHQPTGQC